MGAGSGDGGGLRSALELSSATPPADWLMSPIRRFAGLSTAGGILLIVCAAAAMLWSNFAPHEYEALLHANISITVGGFEISQGVLHWIDDTLMAVFFLLVGLEIKRELISGELSSPKRAALPLFAALGGMVVPAGIYVAVVGIGSAAGVGGEGAVAQWGGWGVPMATDIAFALGILALLGRRAPLALRVFLSALAVADDLGALAVIAVFYTERLDFGAMGMAGVVYAVLVLCAMLKVRESLIYILLGMVLLYFMSESGVHSTIAGVLVASVIPVSARVDVGSYVESTRKAVDVIEEEERRAGAESPELTPMQLVAAQIVSTNSRHIRPPLHRIEHTLGPWVAFLILPVFALTNAGVDLSGVRLEGGSLVVGIAVFLGLVVGKPLGIVGASWVAIRLGLASMPRGVGWPRMWGVGLLGGIGFTMAIFISGLAFPDSPGARDVAKLAVLMGSVVASVLGLVVLLRRHATAPPPEPVEGTITMDESLESLEERLGGAPRDLPAGSAGGD